MPSVLVTPPATEPLSLAEGYFQLKETVTSANMDAEIAMSIQTAREMCENDCRRALISQQWKVTFDNFSRPGISNIASSAWYGPQWDIAPGPLQFVRVDGVTGYEIELPRPPLISVDTISYVDGAGVTQTLNVTTDILVDKVSEPARILPAFNTTWPATQAQVNAASITYTCGYGTTAASVPACARQWMKAMLGAVHELRQAEFSAFRETLVVPTHIDRLLDPIRYRKY